MLVSARSIVKGTLIGTLIWIVGVAVLNLVIFLVFDSKEIRASAVAFSIIGLCFKVIYLLYITFLALAGRDVDIADDNDRDEDKDSQQ